MYHAYEQEGVAEKKQLVSLHQQHVQASFNKKKRELMENLASELEEDEPRVSINICIATDKALFSSEKC